MNRVYLRIIEDLKRELDRQQGDSSGDRSRFNCVIDRFNCVIDRTGRSRQFMYRIEDMIQFHFQEVIDKANKSRQLH